jgi:hypothetical protein
MHPADFVRTRIDERKIDNIVDMINRFRAKLSCSKTNEHASVYNFASMFLISVVGQLHRLSPGQDLHDDKLLAVWAELGYWGIERDQLQDDTEE